MDANGRHAGRIKSVSYSVPTPIVVDGSGWERAPGPRSTGRMRSVTHSLPALIPGPFQREPSIPRAVVFVSDSPVSADQVRATLQRVIALIAALDPDLQFDVAPPEDGTAQITLVPRQPAPAADRVAEIVQVINSQLAGIMKGVPKFQLLAA